MSLLRTGIRVAIRSAAPPLLMIYIFYKFWLQAKDQPWYINLVDSYRKLYKKIKTKVLGSREEQEQRPNEPEWSYQH